MSENILSIDVSSELETLCKAQLRGIWQVPAELVRLAMRLDAGEVSVVLRRRGFAMTWSDGLIDGDVPANLRIALDANGSPDSRQRAIAAIEASGSEALLWASGLRGARTRIVVTAEREQWCFEHHGRSSGLVRKDASRRPNTVEIEWSCRGLDRRRAIRWLAIAARFAPKRVLVNGHPVPRHFVGGLFHLRVEHPVPCALGLTRNGDDPVLWLLRDGVVSTRATIPGYPPFEAAVELKGLMAPGASSADMRRAVTPYLEELVDRAVWMMVEVSGRLSDMAAGDADRICLLLLRAARKGLRTSEICRLDLVPIAADARRRVSVEEIRELAARSGGVLSAIDRGEAAAEGIIDSESTLRASSEVRDLLTELTGARFQSPTLRARAFPIRVADGMRRSSRRLVRRWRGLVAGREVPADELSPRERVVQAAMRTAISPVDVCLCEGRGLAGRTARRLVVPRSSRAMVAGADLIASESIWLYPLLLALDTGFDPVGELRTSWLTASGRKLIQITPDGDQSVRQ